MLKNLLLVSCFLHATSGSFDSSVCTVPTTPSAKARPTISPTFEVHIECTIINKNMTTEVHEFYDQSSNHGEVRQTEMGTSFYGYYDYSVNEFLGIYPQAGVCTVSDLSTSDNRFLFGYNTTGSGPGQGRIYTAAGALHFTGNGIVEVYQGTDQIRGINVEKWYSCQYWKGMDATMNVTWYFSDPNEWDMALSVKSTPVRARVTGKIGPNSQSSPMPHPFDHIYDLIFFRPFIETPHAFETPSMISCPGRKTTKNFPTIAPAFSFTVEILNLVTADVRFMHEWYDSEMKLVRYVYTPQPSTANAIYGFQPLTEIHDFNTGMAYVTDNKRGNCSWQLIEMNSFDDVKADAFDVRMRTASQFFYMNTTGVTYEGVKATRGINTDTYVGSKNGLMPGIPLNTTFEWRFLTTDYTRVQSSMEMYTGGVPVKLTLSVPAYEIDFSYDIYNYVQAKPDTLTWDISACYYNLNRRKFDFTVPGSYSSKIHDSEELFKYAVLLSMMSYAAVTPLRIAQLKIVYQTDVHIRFQLLDVAPMNGDVRKHPKETPLNVAANLIINAINNNKMIFPLLYDPTQDPLNVVATPNSIQEYQYEDELNIDNTGYGGGAMGGLAVGMIILGGAGGAGVSFFFFK